MTAPLILHHDAGTPGSIRARKSMALKSIAWKSHVLDATAADRWRRAVGTPTVLQAGADFYVGAETIMDFLEDVCPRPTFFPNGNRGMPLALAFWSAHFFRVVGEHLRNGQPGAASADAIAHAALIERQLADSRAFLQGDEPGIADLQGYSVLSALIRRGLDSDAVCSDCQHVRAWMARIDVLGEGEATPVSLEDCRAFLEAAAQDAGRHAVAGEGIRLRCLGESEWIAVSKLERVSDFVDVRLEHADLGAIHARYLAACIETDTAA